MDVPRLILKKGEERRLRSGHLWVFSNEVDTNRTALKELEPGAPVRVEAADGRFIGNGYGNPHSLICARLVSRKPDQFLDRSLLVHRLKVARSLRERFYEQPYYRLVHGEADLLPGLVVDRYGDLLVAQLNTAGMEAARDDVVAALEKVVRPRGILLRNDGGTRKLEGLESYVETAAGEVPDETEVVEGDAVFTVPVTSGQKTGWFFDQRANREALARYCHGARVLDVFSYLGGWGVQAALAGAEEVVCVESSASALERIGGNAERNGVVDRVSGLHGDAFEALEALRTEQERFDIVVLDPPAFIKRKREVKSGLEGYRRLNQAGMQLLGKDGLLVSASCSHHLQADAHRDLLRRSARHLDRHLQIVGQGHQAPDHPIHPAIPETEYLKCLTCRVALF